MSERSLATLPKELQGVRAAGSYDFDQLYRFAQVCHASGLFEDVTDAAQAFIKIAKGQELGLPPMAAMTGFDLIRKRLFIKPWVIAAKINTCGYGSYRVTVQTPTQCTIVFARKYPGEGWVPCEPVTYTFAEAKAHGLVERSPHWKANPAHMLYQRCLGRGGLMYFPELLAGLDLPPETTPLAPDRHQQNIIDLFGEGGSAAATQPGRPQEGPQQPQEATNAPWVVPPEGGQPHGPARGQKEGVAWETLRAHRNDARVPAELRDQIRTALSPDEPATDSEAHVLAGAILDWQDAPQEEGR
jgi:hypothetical protein